jgi:hypothetical protein
MEATIDVLVPQATIGGELRERLALLGLNSKLVDYGEGCALEVSFADVRERLLADVTHAIETWLSELDLPLVVQRANGSCVLRPPGD